MSLSSKRVDSESNQTMPHKLSDLLFGYMHEIEKELSIKIPELITLTAINYYPNTHHETQKNVPSCSINDLFDNEDDSEPDEAASNDSDEEQPPHKSSHADSMDYYEIMEYYGIKKDDDQSESDSDSSKEYPFEVDFEALKLVSQKSKDVISGYIREAEKKLSIIIPELVILISILFYYQIEKAEERAAAKSRRKHSRGPSFEFKDLFMREQDSESEEEEEEEEDDEATLVSSALDATEYYALTAYYGLGDEDEDMDLNYFDLISDDADNEAK